MAVMMMESGWIATANPVKNLKDHQNLISPPEFLSQYLSAMIPA